MYRKRLCCIACALKQATSWRDAVMNKPETGEREVAAKRRETASKPEAHSSEQLLPRELWLIIMRSLDSMRDHNAMARTCALFAALARYEVERAKYRLARDSETGYCYQWHCCVYDGIVMGPRLANGKFHGRCFALGGESSDNRMVEFEARDGLRQGETWIWEGPSGERISKELAYLWLHKRLGDLKLACRCFYSDDKQEGFCIGYRADHPNPLCDLRLGVLDTSSFSDWSYFEDDEEEGTCYHGEISGNTRARFDHVHVQHGIVSGTAVFYRGDGTLKRITINEDDETASTCSYHKNGATRCMEVFGADTWSVSYYDDGTLCDVAYIEDNRVEGPYLVWYRNGQLQNYAIYRGGSLQGWSYSWRADGTLVNVEWVA